MIDHDYSAEDARADALAEARADMPRKRPQGCQCFSPGGVSGTCPGPENCPMCDDYDEEDES